MQKTEGRGWSKNFRNRYLLPEKNTSKTGREGGEKGKVELPFLVKIHLKDSYHFCKVGFELPQFNYGRFHIWITYDESGIAIKAAC